MFGAIKKIFGRSTGTGAVSHPVEPPSSPFTKPKSAAAPPQKAAPPPIPRAPARAKSGDEIVVQLTSIVALLPKELQAGITLSGNEGRTFTIPRQQILPQLAHGAVKITYKELRDAFPMGMFPNRPGEDDRLIDLPLQEILVQVDQRSFNRRTNQHKVSVPDDIDAVFSKDGQMLITQARVVTKEEKSGATEIKRKTPAPVSHAAAPAPAPAPAAYVAPPRAPAPAQMAASSAPAPALAPAAVTAEADEAPPKPIAVNPHLAALMNQASAAAKAKAPAYAPPKIENGILSIALADMAQNWPEGIATEIRVQQWTNVRCEVPVAELTVAMRQGKAHYPWKQIRTWMKPAATAPSAFGEVPLELPLKIIANLLLSQTNHPPKPAAPIEQKPQPSATASPTPAPATSKAPAASVPPPSAGIPSGSTAFLRGHTTSFAKKEVVSIPLATISSGWPEMLRKEIDHLNLTSSIVAVPVESLETALKQGKVAFFWKQVCQWIEACPPAAFASNFAEVRLEWPLNVIAPMFLQSRPKKEAKAAPLHIDIPDVFAAKNQPAPAHQPAAAPTPVQAPPPAAAEAVTAQAPRKVPKDLAELFGEPEKRNWTPNEIVQKTCQLPGLDGALIALQDGLLVASCMPPAWKTETIAAFLPQIFGRMHQYTRELKMGELTSVNFTVEQGTLQIFNAGIIYFAALGKQGGTMPVPELNLIARELSRHTK